MDGEEKKNYEGPPRSEAGGPKTGKFKRFGQVSHTQLCGSTSVVDEAFQSAEL